MPGLGNIRTPTARPPTAGPVAAPGVPTSQDLIKDLLDEEIQKQKRQEEVDRLKTNRQTNIQEGKDFIKDFTLGRIADDPARQAENLKLKELLEGRLGGLSSGEGAAMREQAFGGLNRQRQEGIRSLRGQQGAQGIRGPAAVAQQQNVFSQAADRGSDLEQQLLLRNIDIKRQAAADFGGEIQRQQGQNLGIEQFNIGQGDQETGIQTAFPLQFANLGLQEEAAATGAVSGQNNLIVALMNAFPGLFGPQGPIAPPPIAAPITQPIPTRATNSLETAFPVFDEKPQTARHGPVIFGEENVTDNRRRGEQ